MPLRYLLDEHLTGTLYKALRRHNAHSPYPVEYLGVGDPSDLPQGSRDPDILLWAERANYIVVSADRKTMVRDFGAHVSSGHFSPGLFIVRKRAQLLSVLDSLVVAAHASKPEEWVNVVQYIP